MSSEKMSFENVDRQTMDGRGLALLQGSYVFSCINICQVPRKLFEHEAARPNVQTSSEGPGKC